VKPVTAAVAAVAVAAAAWLLLDVRPRVCARQASPP
jgi:hypothetical protein